MNTSSTRWTLRLARHCSAEIAEQLNAVPVEEIRRRARCDESASLRSLSETARSMNHHPGTAQSVRFGVALPLRGDK